MEHSLEIKLDNDVPLRYHLPFRSQNAVSVQQGRNARATNMPSHWSSMLSKRQYQRVPLSRLSEEFKEVEKLFKKSIKRGVVIVGIERVQNPFMWEKYKRYF